MVNFVVPVSFVILFYLLVTVGFVLTTLRKLFSSQVPIFSVLTCIKQSLYLINILKTRETDRRMYHKLNVVLFSLAEILRISQMHSALFVQ